MRRIYRRQRLFEKVLQKVVLTSHSPRLSQNEVPFRKGVRFPKDLDEIRLKILPKTFCRAKNNSIFLKKRLVIRTACKQGITFATLRERKTRICLLRNQLKFLRFSLFLSLSVLIRTFQCNVH